MNEQVWYRLELNSDFADTLRKYGELPPDLSLHQLMDMEQQNRELDPLKNEINELKS